MKHLDTGSIVVALITLALFATALVVKGLTHDVLLEAGVFLISVKLIMMVHKIGAVEERIDAKLNDITTLLKKPEAKV